MILSHRLLLFAFLALAACDSSTLVSPDTMLASSSDGYISRSSVNRIYHLGPAGAVPVSEVSPTVNAGRLPVSLYNGDYGDRRDTSVPQPMDLVLKVFNQDFSYNGKSNGDFYFESLILSPTYEISNTTTVLSWLLRHGFNRADFLVSRNLWDSAAGGIEVFCNDCRAKTNSEVLALVLANASYLSELEAALRKENPSLTNLQWTGFQEPAPLLAFDNPPFGENATASLISKEGVSIKLRILFVDVRHSTKKIEPTRWTHSFNSAEVEHQDGGENYSPFFDYDKAGPNSIVVDLQDARGNQSFTYDVDVKNTNRPPVWQTGVMLTTQANRRMSVNLGSYCSDPDAGTILSYQLVNGPTGLGVLPTGALSWQPVQPASGTAQLGDFPVQIECFDNDNDRKSEIGTITVHVDPDTLPVFSVIPASWNLSEGTLGTVDVEVTDAEGDPISLDVMETSAIKTGLPVGSGIFNVTTLGSTANTTTFRVSFIPSYLQRIGSNGSLAVAFMAHYDGSSGNFDATSSRVSQDMTLNFTNVDDPPQWTAVADSHTVTEGSPFSGFAGGSVFDPNPNPTALTYAIDSADPRCLWPTLAVNPVTLQISGTPTLTSPRQCSFTLLAKDATGLASSSQEFIYDVTNTNQPVVVRPDALTAVSIDERKALTVDLLDIFNDPDLDIGDEYERLQYQCLNCGALGITSDFALDSRQNRLRWTPNSSASDNSPYVLQLQATDIGGVTVTSNLTITVNDGPSEMLVIPTQTSLTLSENVSTPATSTSLIIAVSPPSGNPVDAYLYTFSEPVCRRTDGTLCRFGLITNPASMTGDGSLGSKNFIFTITPNATDGDAPIPAADANYNISFTVYKTDDPTLLTTVAVSLKIQNVNRAPTQLGVGALNATAGPYTYGSSTMSIAAIDANRDRKLGTSWMNTYTIPFDLMDADGGNDDKIFQIITPYAPGSITGGVWSFKMPNCLQAGSVNITRTYTVTGSDGRGGSVNRNVQLTFRNVQNPPAGCL
ncbi:MAG: hypothetical protein KF802_15065 [Bdellovibrionaceae bacterium]|nr:hypothetical protein [Pseudobdellovibrionaceae bacterium]